MAKEERRSIIIVSAKFFASLFVVFIAGLFGSLFTIPNINTWYAGLEKPPLTPPDEVFGPVWSILYLLMGISLFLVWTAKSTRKLKAYGWFVLQLVLNVAWPIIFFGMRLPWVALAVILMLIVAIIVTMVMFYRHRRWASYLLAPYAVWTCFAAYLNIGVALLL